MKVQYETTLGKLYKGNVLDVLGKLEDKSVQVCVTSPPYWGLRSYGTEQQIWSHCKAGSCEYAGVEHQWGDEIPNKIINNQGVGSKLINPNTYSAEALHDQFENSTRGTFCQKCGAWRGSLGLEPTPELFIEHIVQIFSEVKRVLRDDGTLWLNFGDSYNTTMGTTSYTGINEHGSALLRDRKGLSCKTLKPKDLIGIPWRVAFALQKDGWYLRSAMPWLKRSCMPESCKDRPSSALEYMFLMTKSPKYYFDMDAIKPVSIDPESHTGRRKRNTQLINKQATMNVEKNNLHKLDGEIYSTRNFRNTDLFYQSIEPPHGILFVGDEPVGIDVNPQAFKDAHFATFPERLISPAILSGTSEKGCCSECGKPWERIIEVGEKICQQWAPRKNNPHKFHDKRENPQENIMTSIKSTIGWKATCDCKQSLEPCVVLDPFFGSGTTGLVCEKFNRKWIGIDLGFSDIAKRRIEPEHKKGKETKRVTKLFDNLFEEEKEL